MIKAKYFTYSHTPASSALYRDDALDLTFFEEETELPRAHIIKTYMKLGQI